MDLIEGSETSAIINQTPGNYPKESLLDKNHIKAIKAADLCYRYSMTKSSLETKNGIRTAITSHTGVTVLGNNHQLCRNPPPFCIPPTDGQPFSWLFIHHHAFPIC